MTAGSISHKLDQTLFCKTRKLVHCIYHRCRRSSDHCTVRTHVAEGKCRFPCCVTKSPRILSFPRVDFLWKNAGFMLFWTKCLPPSRFVFGGGRQALCPVTFGHAYTPAGFIDGTMYPRDLHRSKLAVIYWVHIMPDIYPECAESHTHRPFILPYSIACSPTQRFLVCRCSVYKQVTTQTALDFMCAASPTIISRTRRLQSAAPHACKQHGLSICSLMELPELFSSGQDWFTDIGAYTMHQSNTHHGFDMVKTSAKHFSISRADTVSAF